MIPSGLFQKSQLSTLADLVSTLDLPASTNISGVNVIQNLLKMEQENEKTNK